MGPFNARLLTVTRILTSIIKTYDDKSRVPVALADTLTISPVETVIVALIVAPLIGALTQNPKPL